MKIPSNTNKPRFYVAYSDDEAFSSWDTLEDAKACVDRFKDCDCYVLKDAVKIIGIIETSQSSKILHKIPTIRLSKMNKKQAIQIIGRYFPCSHSDGNTKLGFGTTYAQCEACGETFLIAKADDYIKRSKDFEDALDYLSDLEEPPPPTVLAKEIPLGSKYFLKNEEVEIIAYSKQGDQVVVVENREGKVWCENINDIIFNAGS